MSKLEELRKARQEEINQKLEVMYDNFSKNYSWLLQTYKTDKFVITNYNPISVSDFKEKIFADSYKVFKQLYLAVGKDRFIDFFKFTQDYSTCNYIKKKINENGGIIAGHSYIVISNKREILSNMMAWVMFELTNMNINLIMKSQEFEMVNFAHDLEKDQKRMYQSEDDESFDFENISGDIYYDFVRLNPGYVFPSENDEYRAYAYINNRMVDLMNKYKVPKGMIILTSKPIPFFTKQSENIDNLHILDLRNITTTPKEMVEME